MTGLTSVAVSFLAFDPERDASWLHELWRKSMPGRWSLSMAAMLEVLSSTSLLLVAEAEGARLGFCAVDSSQGAIAGLVLLLVEPSHQRLGIGNALITRMEAILREHNIRRLKLGSGSGSYFWPGLPAELSRTWRFFAKMGFTEEEPSEDLAQALVNFRTPDWVAGRLLSSGTSLWLAEPLLREQIITFENTNFPAWAPYFENEMRESGYQNILVAEAADHRIVGTILMKTNTTVPWDSDSGTRIGSLNILGVASDVQGQGIGLALTAGAMEHLRDRGCSHCYIQWTGLSKWYGKLGATVWARYRMACKHL